MASRNRGKPKPKFIDLTKPLTTAEAIEIRNQLLQMQPPLVTAILGQALVESQLDILLRNHFSRRDETTWEALTDEPGPLSSFQRKITAAYAFGICDEIIRDGLNTIRRIRNAFGHSRRPIDFANEFVIQKLRTISLPTRKRTQVYKNLSLVHQIANTKPKSSSIEVGYRAGYVILCEAIELQLMKKHSARVVARQRRNKKSSHNQLTHSLLGLASAPRGGVLTGLLAPQTGDHNGESQKPDRPVAPGQKAKKPHKTGK